MSLNVRLVAKWRDFASRLAKTIQEKEQQSHDSQGDKESTIYLDIHPSVQFHCPCAPGDHLQCITAYTGHHGNVVLGFQWGQTVFKHQIHMWLDDGVGNLRHHSTTPMYGRYKMERMLFVPSQHVLVGYCNDLCLRVLTDNTQEMVVLYHTQCPASVLCMHYCLETNELLTGSMGLIAFWGFWTSAQTPLSLLRILDWTRCSIERETVVSAFVSQRQTNSIYVLCDRNIKNFEHTGQNENFEFRGQSYATLRCVVPEWRQRYLYTGDADGYVQVWSCDIRRLFLQFRAHATAVTSVVLLAESGSILTASTGCWIKQWTRSGDLLLKLHINMPGGVRSMWPLSKNIVMCQSATILDVWRLNSIYRSFNDTACTVRVLRRVECCRGRCRILAVTLDGIIRFLSPVTGELLFLSWPFLHIDKALGFAYAPSQEELYLCDGSVEVLVLNTTLSPCPVTRVINTVRDGNDGVLCLETVMVWSSQDGAGDESPNCLVFSGHRNGKLELLSPLGVFCEPQKAHNGAISQISSLPGQRPSICCYGTDCLFTVWSVRLEQCEVVLTLEGQIICDFTPVHYTLMDGLVCAVSPQQHLIFYSVHGVRVAERERKRSERISCLDYCPQLAILALTGSSGKIEIWSHEGDLVAEIQLGVPVTQLCFGNARGDILASFADSISIISATHVLPASYLRTVLGQAPLDDIVELPIPFLPKSPLHYDIGLVPKVYLKYLNRTKEKVMIEPTPDQTTTEGILEGIPPEEQKEQTSKFVIMPYCSAAWRAPVARTAKNTQPTPPEVEPNETPDAPNEALIQTKRCEQDFLSLFRHIALDGYIPNSVIRAIHLQEEEEEEEEAEEEESLERFLPTCLLRDFEEKEDASEHTQAIQEILTRAKVTRRVNAQLTIFNPEATGQEERQVPEKKVPEKKMPEKKSQETEEEIDHVKQRVDVLLEHLNVTCQFSYTEYSNKLLEVLRKQHLKQSLLDQVRGKLLSHIRDASLVWRQHEGLKYLHLMQLLLSDDIALIGTFLASSNQELRDLTRYILRDVFQICEKQALKEELQKTMSMTTLEPFLDQLSDDLVLKENVDHDETSHKATKQRRKSQDMTGRTHRSSSIKSEFQQHDVQRRALDHNGQRRALDHNDSQKVRRSSKVTDGSTKVSKEQENLSDNEAKQTQIQTGMFDRTTFHHTPEPARQKKRAVKPRSKKENLTDLEQAGPSPNDPLLYAFRKSRKHNVATYPTVEKYESHLLPSDSGLGSLVSQEMSSEKVPFGGEDGGSLPITKPHKLISKPQDLISQHPQHVSQYFRYISQDPEHISQHPHYVSEHHDYISQHPHYSSQHPQHMHKHPRHMTQHPLQFSQHPQQISQHAQRISQHGRRISQRPRHMTQHPQQISQQPGHLSRRAALAAEEPGDHATVPGDTDPHWRESLHKLISLHGFRSQKAARAAASLCAWPLALQARDTSRTLPRLLPRPACKGALGERVAACQGALGERVAQSTEMTDACRGPVTTFQHQLPLPWRLGHFPLQPHGQLKYGRLEMDWVRADDAQLSQTGRITLPKINPKGSHVQA
ncbi:hypothetical protein AALO_G00034290 [Alosa alosa]|uniref:WD repeat-containing protein 87 n=2 Tax=Alosa alosa TaxID=278164 RepID=A0AAV6HCV0_9TELE|nr:hypothetical protein AALO_G00034290 [Alosa alosa]